MRLSAIFSTFIFVTAVLCAFSPDEIELFETQNKLVKIFNERSFYTFFEIPKSASTKSIIKNYKKLSRKYHPDKIKRATKKDIQKYELLNVVYDVLKSGRREKYDFYLQRGFPKYDSTDMKFKSRVFKPSMIFISIFLLFVLSVIHYLILKVGYSSQVTKLQNLIDEIKSTGSKIEDLDYQERRVTSHELQKDFLVRIDGVFLIDYNENNQEVFSRVTTDEIPVPSITDVFTLNIPLKLWNKTKIYPIDLEKKIPGKDIIVNNPAGKEEKKTKKRTKLPNGKIVYK